MPEIGQTLSHYRILEKIGVGGMGEVYLADDFSLDRKVALKFLPDIFTGDPERMARFEREAKLLASLNHPNIAAIYSLEQADGKRFLIMEYVEGETLQARLSKGALPLEDALALCRQIADGLEAAHEKGVIHRDLKPANVMITAEEKVKILDFGLGKALSDNSPSVDSSQSPTLTLTETMTRPGMILGTAAYMSPEQAKGKSVDNRADIWAFGCILYECLTGKRAFGGETVTETLAAVLDNEPDWRALPHTIPHDIRFVMQRCLSKDASQRLHHAADVRIQMEDTRITIEAPVPAKSQRAAWIVAMVGIIAAGWLSFLHFREESPPSAPLYSFQIPLPDNVNLPDGSPFLLSPNGRHLAFIAGESEGMNHIWIHSFDKLVAQPLQGTESENISSIIWSPDSRFIAFESGGKLKKINIFAGPPQELCDVPKINWGGSWTREGRIVYRDELEGVAYSVPEDGGAASLLLKPSEIKRGMASPILDHPTLQRTAADSFAALLPDGRHFLFRIVSEKLENSAVYLGTFESDPDAHYPKLLVNDTLGFVYMPSPDARPGYLLFLRGTTLLGQLFDEKRLELLGDPVPIADKVGSFYIRCFFSASSNGVLVYRSAPGSQSTQATLFNRQGKKIGEVGEPGSFYGMAFSPDGKQVALGWDQNLLTSATSANIWLFNLSLGNPRQFTLGKDLNSTPLWSPDGTWIAFSRLDFQDVTKMGLYRRSTDGAQPEELVLQQPGHLPTGWSRDGKFLLFAGEDPETKIDLWVLPMEGDRKKKKWLATEYNEMDGRFSPEMRWIAYVSDEEGAYEVYVREFSPYFSAEETESLVPWRISQGGGMGPRWRNDGRELYYRTPDGDVMAVEITFKPTFRVGIPETLFSAPSAWSFYANFNAFVTWDVNGEGSRFLLPVPVEETAQAPFNVVINWTSLLEQ